MIGPVLAGGLAAASVAVAALALRRIAGSRVLVRLAASPTSWASPSSSPMSPTSSGALSSRRVGAPSAAQGLRRLASSRAGWAGAAALVGWIAGGAVGAVAAVLVATLAGAMRQRRSAARRAAVMDDGMADAVRAIAAGMRAGLSVPQAIRFAADEAEPPLSGSLCRLVDAVDVGEPLDEAIERWAGEVGTDDARLVQGVLGLHRRSGGDLPRVLDRVTETLRERRSVSREVRALTAQARLSGAILGLLPIGFFAFLWLTSRRDIEAAFKTPAGLVAVSVGVALELVAFVWIRRLLEVR